MSNDNQKCVSKKQLKNRLGCSYETLAKWIARLKPKLKMYVDGDRLFAPVDVKIICDHVVNLNDDNE